MLKTFRKNPLLKLRAETNVRLPALDTEVLYLYGVGPYYGELKEWLRANPRRRLIFLEDDKSHLSFFLNQTENERVLLDPQVQLVVLSDPIEHTLKEVIFSHLLSPSECMVMPGKDPTFHSFFTLFEKNVQMEMSLCRAYGLPELKNVLRNLEYPFYKGEELEGRLKGYPAIICGAGPSLSQNIDLLKTLGDRAFLFVGGSALAINELKDLSFYLGGALDPLNDPVKTVDCPFFYQNQVASSLREKVKGSAFCFGNQSIFPLENFLLQTSNVFDAGTHVGTFLTHVAYILGCDPIIFVGMDGAYRIGGQNDSPQTIDRQGKTVQTRSEFLIGHAWLSYFKKTHLETRFYNATEGGCAIEGVRDLTLTEVKRQFLHSSFDPKAVWEKVTGDLILQKLNLDGALKIKESLKQTISMLDKRLADLKAVFPKDSALENESFYQLVLLPLWERWKYVLQTDEIVKEMENPKLEKSLQQLLFFKKVCDSYQTELF